MERCNVNGLEDLILFRCQYPKKLSTASTQSLSNPWWVFCRNGQDSPIIYTEIQLTLNS